MLVALLLLPIVLPAAVGQNGAGETLYNGIRLPSPWPPSLQEIPREPVTPVYLTAPPSVIPIDIGRQLFVDDFLIDTTTLLDTKQIDPKLTDINGKPLPPVFLAVKPRPTT